MYGIIYIAVNVLEGKRYIGQTTKTLKSRIKGHYDTINNGTYFHRALLKHGNLAFAWYIIDSSATDQYSLNELEKLYIAVWKSLSTQSGYNMTPGGDTSWEFGRLASIKQVSLFDINGTYIDTYESAVLAEEKSGVKRQCISYSAIQGHPTFNTRWQFGDSTDYKFPLRSRGSKIYQFDAAGELVGEYDNSIHAREITGIASNTIRQCSQGKLNSAGGFYWSTREDFVPISPIRKPWDKRPIIQYDISGIQLAEYKNYSAIGKANLGHRSAKIRLIIDTDIPCHQGYIWKHKP